MNAPKTVNYAIFVFKIAGGYGEKLGYKITGR